MTARLAGVLVILSLVCAACGDADTTDHRGYTKAPLEHPTLAIRAERPSEISRYGAPNRVVAEEIEVAEAPPATSQPVQQQTPAVQLPEGVTQEMVTQGQQIFKGAGTCFICHGQSAEGTMLAPALNDATWLNIDGGYESIVQLISSGVPAPKQSATPMPPRGGSQIDDEQVRQVAAYVYSISR